MADINDRNLLGPSLLALALSAPFLLFGNLPSAMAGSCTNTSPFTASCSGPADTATDSTQVLNFNPSNYDLGVVYIEENFGHDTSSTGGSAIEITANDKIEDLYVLYKSNASITGEQHALDIRSDHLATLHVGTFLPGSVALASTGKNGDAIHIVTGRNAGIYAGGDYAI